MQVQCSLVKTRVKHFKTKRRKETLKSDESCTDFLRSRLKFFSFAQPYVTNENLTCKYRKFWSTYYCVSCLTVLRSLEVFTLLKTIRRRSTMIQEEMQPWLVPRSWWNVGTIHLSHQRISRMIKNDKLSVKRKKANSVSYVTELLRIILPLRIIQFSSSPVRFSLFFALLPFLEIVKTDSAQVRYSVR